MGTSAGSALVFLGPTLQAREAWSALRAHGIEALLLEQYGALGYDFGPVEVLVPLAQLEMAQEILSERGFLSPGTPA